jgi:ISXO2-like transposase domain
MVQKYVLEKDSVLITDSYSRYNSMKKVIEQIKTDHLKFYSYKGISSNTIEYFWAVIERSIMGHYRSVTPKMLPNYVAEHVYKFNHRNNNPEMFDEMLARLFKPISL